jgi:hypothetical protein
MRALYGKDGARSEQLGLVGMLVLGWSPQQLFRWVLKDDSFILKPASISDRGKTCWYFLGDKGASSCSFWRVDGLVGGNGTVGAGFTTSSTYSADLY